MSLRAFSHVQKHRAQLLRSLPKKAGFEKDLALRSFHTLPRRGVMEKCAYNATVTPEINRVFNKVMTSVSVCVYSTYMCV